MSSFQLTDSLDRALSYQYDANDNRTKLTVMGTEVTNYTYSAANQPLTLGPTGGPFTTYTYDSLHRVSLKTLPTGAKTIPAYDSISNLLSLTHKTSGDQVLLSTSYTYDVLGNRLTRTDSPSLTPLPTTTDPSAWSYDVANRLQSRPGVTIRTTTTGTRSRRPMPVATTNPDTRDDRDAYED